MNIMNMLLMCTSISMILLMISMFLEKKIKNNKESASSFECGFNSSNNKSKMVSSQFFSIAILFLIFDVEIGFIVPIPLSESFYLMSNLNIMLIIMLFTISTIMEWKMGMIEWMK